MQAAATEKPANVPCRSSQSSGSAPSPNPPHRGWVGGPPAPARPLTPPPPPRPAAPPSQLLRDVRFLLRSLRREEEGDIDAVVLASRLSGVGYRVHMRSALGGGAGVECFTNLRNEFLVVQGEGGSPDLIVEVRAVEGRLLGRRGPGGGQSICVLGFPRYGVSVPHGSQPRNSAPELSPGKLLTGTPSVGLRPPPLPPPAARLPRPL